MYEMNAREYNSRVMKGLFKKVYPLIACQILNRTGMIEGNCIDLGGGPGMLGISLAKITNLHVTIYDLLPECVEIAFENIAESAISDRVTARQGQAENICFPDNSIDLVISRGSVFFWEDQEKGFKEVHRVLKPGGWAYIGGGMGSARMAAEVAMARAKNPDKDQSFKKRIDHNPPEHFQSILQKLAIPGLVENSIAGTWIIFQKQA